MLYAIAMLVFVVPLYAIEDLGYMWLRRLAARSDNETTAVAVLAAGVVLAFFAAGTRDRDMAFFIPAFVERLWAWLCRVRPHQQQRLELHRCADENVRQAQELATVSHWLKERLREDGHAQ